MTGWSQACYEADQAYQLFLRTKDSPSAQKATEVFGKARDHLQRSASLLPECRVIIDYMPRDIPSVDVHRILEKVGLGAEETELTRMIKEVKALEERIAKMEEELRAVTAEREAVTAERDSLKRKLDEV